MRRILLTVILLRFTATSKLCFLSSSADTIFQTNNLGTDFSIVFEQHRGSTEGPFMSTIIGSLLESLAGVIVGEAVVQGGRRTPRDGNPYQQQRQTPQRPLATLVDSVLELGNRAFNMALKALQYLMLFQVLLLSAVVLYGALYWLVMPLRVHDKPLYFDYSSRATTGGAMATVDFQAEHTQWDPSPLTEVRRLQNRPLKSGQHYKIDLELMMPTSQVNRNVGVFMVHTTLLDDQDNVLARSARPVVLPHTSGLLKGITMLFSWPLYLLGVKKEAETIFVPCIDFYKESSQHPLTKAKVTTSSGRVQFYRASMHITPQLKGLPWLMHDWFYSTFAAGVIFITSLEIITVGFVYFFLVLGPEDNQTQIQQSDDQNRAAIRAGASRYTAVSASSIAQAGGRVTTPGVGGAASDEGLRRRGSSVRSHTMGASQGQDRPPGVQAYQRGTKYVIGGRGRGGTPTGTSERQGVGESERSDPSARVGSQEESNAPTNAPWVALDGNITRDSGREGLERQSSVGASAAVGADDVAGGATIIQPGGDGLRESDVVGEGGNESAGEDS